MKKIISPFLIVLLLIFSFYYTNKVVDILKEKDPIMQEIKKTEEKYKIDAMNAQIIGNSILSGKSGKTIDYEESYNKMKKYGTYNESLTTLKETMPVISIENNYDKYLVGGNKKDRKVSLVFIGEENSNLETIVKILDLKKIEGTFFIEGTYLENNISFLKKHNNHEYELLSYKKDYEKTFFTTALSYLETITNQKPKYCYTEKEKEEILNLCKSLKLHTIKPTISLKKNIYKEVKENLSNSIIISLEVNSYVEEELPATIDYINQKGFKIVRLNDLVSESN